MKDSITLEEINNHIADLRLVQSSYKKDGELWQAVEDRIHAIEKMVEIIMRE